MTDRPNTLYRWTFAAFAVHSVFIGLVILTERFPSPIRLRTLHEAVIDRPAYEAWWSLQNHYPRELGDLLFPLAVRYGLETTSFLFWVAWYLILGALPYVVAAAIAGWLRMNKKPDPHYDGIEP